MTARSGEANAAMDKIVERLLTMAGEGATADQVTQLLAVDGTALLRDLLQGYRTGVPSGNAASTLSAPTVSRGPRPQCPCGKGA